MTHSIECCDWCGKVLEGIRGDRHGMLVTLGFSKGGWGSREDFINQSKEVCSECFAIYTEMAAAFKHALAKRKDVNKPTIRVQHPNNPEWREGDPVRDVRNDQPSPNGRFRKILRLLS